MATIDELTQMINTLTTTVNAITNNSKKISELSLKTPIELTDEIPIGSEKKLTVSQIVDRALADYDLETVIGYTVDELNSTIRKTLSPYSYVSYLPKATPYTTPSLAGATPTKILIPTTIKTSNGWGVADIGGGNLAVKYTGDTTETHKIFMSTSMTTGTNNVVVTLDMYRNGVFEPGISISRKVGTGADVGALAVLGEFTVNTNDYIEIYITVDLASTITFSRTSIVITEKN